MKMIIIEMDIHKKTVHSSESDITLNIPRDRQGTFDPIVVENNKNVCKRNVKSKYI